ncbi:MAG TPA: hypothetical protein VKR58_06110 [Aquella sp.]|nr:hypothetical protein [Aquella sp.]
MAKKASANANANGTSSNGGSSGKPAIYTADGEGSKNDTAKYPQVPAKSKSSDINLKDDVEALKAVAGIDGDDMATYIKHPEYADLNSHSTMDSRRYDSSQF